MQRMKTPPIIALILLALSWLLATWPPTDRFGAAGSTVQIDDISAGFNLLMAGALPWLLQWAAIAVLAYALCRAKLGFKRSYAWAVISVPLLTASIWWIGLATRFWSSNLLEFIADVTLAHTDQQLGGAPLWYEVLFDFAGPMTFPIVAQGIVSLGGWNFLISGLSTALVMLLFTLFFVRARQIEDAPITRQLRVAVPFALLWTLPLTIRCGMRIFASIRLLQDSYP
ncbi:MAG: hypothetical protein CMJ48_05150 [Planctomycetaceae bacterium]|nr:hypothetical protein [Planctomycetaceae bacterium]